MHYGASVEWPGALIKDIIDIVKKSCSYKAVSRPSRTWPRTYPRQREKHNQKPRGWKEEEAFRELSMVQEV